MLGKVIIYADKGTDRFGVNCLIRHLIEIFDGWYEVEAIRHIDVEPGYLCHKDNKLFIMPGGLDVPYCKLLDGDPTHAIQQYVEEGGVYLGICAGAYFASRRVEFETGTAKAIQGRRELRLADVIARGSISDITEGKYDPESISGAAAVRVQWGEDMMTSYYHAGPEFIFDRPVENLDIIATYPDAKGGAPAIIRQRVGLGQAILCSPHFEIGADDLRRYDRQDMAENKRAHAIADKLDQAHADTHKALGRLMELAGLDLPPKKQSSM